jgi:hypothetical protein
MLAVFLTALATQVAANLPFTMPTGIPDPLAYYWLNDHAPGTGIPSAPHACMDGTATGCAGMTVKESMSDVADAGYVEYYEVHQPQGAYPGVTWVKDPHFGNVFQCGNKDTQAKDVLRLADVDYGSTGKFTINWWVKNPVGSDFNNRGKEQLFGHGDPYEISNAPNQIHIQVENLHVSDGHDSFTSNGGHIYKDNFDIGGEILLILADSNDAQSCLRSAAGGAWTPNGTIPLDYLEGTKATDPDSGGKLLKMNNVRREDVEDVSSEWNSSSGSKVTWQPSCTTTQNCRRRTTGAVDVFPMLTCDNLFTDLNAEGTADVGGNVVDMAVVLEMCVDANGQAVTSEDDAMMCGRVDRARTIYTSVFSDDERTSVNRPGTIGVSADGTASAADDGWHMMTITTRPDGKKGFALYIDGVKRAALPSETGVGWDRYDYNNLGRPMNGGDPIDPEGPFRFCARELPGDWYDAVGGVDVVEFSDGRYSNVQLAHFSVYNEAMTGDQIEELRQAYVTQFFPDAVEGYASLPGACRGPGADPQKVNSKFKGGMTLDECKQECDSYSGQCKGFAYSASANNGECTIYGPGFAGSCSDASVKSKTLCEQLGTCADAAKCGDADLGKACKDKCGDCSDPTAGSVASCDIVSGTWTPLTWTAAAGTWTEPADGWTGDNQGDTIVASVRPSTSSDYRCYDNDLYDHHPQCTGTVLVPEAVKSGTWSRPEMSALACTQAEVDSKAPGCGSTDDFSCATSACIPARDARRRNDRPGSSCGSDCGKCAKGCAYCDSCHAPGAGWWFGSCSHLFLGLTKEEKLPDICSDIEGCTFVPEIPATPIARELHPKAEQYPGYKHTSGACRMENPDGSGPIHVSGKYSLVAGCSPGFPAGSCDCAPRNGGDGCDAATQKQCKDHCEAEKGCLGYSHRDPISGYPYCILHGSGMNLTDDVWDADNRGFTTGPITGGNGNIFYVCGSKVAATTKNEEQVSESCRPGAMLALALWLTRLWQ